MKTLKTVLVYLVVFFILLALNAVNVLAITPTTTLRPTTRPVPTPIYCSWQTENTLHNDTGVAANGLEKWIAGNIQVLDWDSALFNNFSFIYTPNPTPTPTPTPIVTITFTPTATQEITLTATPIINTITPTATRNFTPTPSPTRRRLTPTPTRTPTPTPTPTRRGPTPTRRIITPTPTRPSGMTRLRWYGGTVESNQTTNCGFYANSYIINHKYLPRWSYDGAPGPVAGPALSHEFRVISSTIMEMIIGNTPVDTSPVTVLTIKVGPSTVVYPFQQLTKDYLDSRITWSLEMHDIHLNTGAKYTLPSISKPSAAIGLVYWAEIILDNDPTNIVEYGGQFAPRPTTPTPFPTPVPGANVVVYDIASDWGTGATVNVTIKNNATTAVNGWTLAWSFPGSQTITNLWNGTYTQSSASVSVNNAAHNAVIAPNGGSVNFGFNMNYSGVNAKPSSFTLNGAACQVQ